MRSSDNKVIPNLKAWKRNEKYLFNSSLWFTFNYGISDFTLAGFTVTRFQKIIFRFQIFQQILESERLLQSLLWNLTYFLFPIILLDKNWREVYPGPPETSKMESFSTNNSQRLLTFNHCCKTLHLRCLRGCRYDYTECHQKMSKKF